METTYHMRPYYMHSNHAHPNYHMHPYYYIHSNDNYHMHSNDDYQYQDNSNQRKVINNTVKSNKFTKLNCFSYGNNVLLPIYFNSYIKKLKILGVNDNNNTGVNEILEIIQKFYNIIVADCKQIIYFRKSNQLMIYKIKNLNKALFEMLESNKSIEKILICFKNEYGLSGNKSVNDQNSLDENKLKFPKIYNYLNVLSIEYNWNNDLLMSHLIKYCIQLCENELYSEDRINDFVSNYISSIKNIKLLTPFNIQNALLDNFIYTLEDIK